MKFQPGQSGNPGGRPGGLTEFRNICRSHSPAAINALLEGLADPARSVAAATVLLGYAWGKPAQALTGEGGEGPARIRVIIEDERDGSMLALEGPSAP